MTNSSPPTISTQSLGIVSITLLIASVTPTGLIHIARYLGLHIKAEQTADAIGLFGILLIGLFILLARYKGKRVAFIVMLLTAILNITGCVAGASKMLSDFSRIS